MVAINKILLLGCTGEECGGDTGTRPDSRVRHRNAENRAPVTRNHCLTQPLVNNLYQGMTLDAVTGLYYERNRDYSPSLGRWMEQDPAQYINGANTYQFVNSSPVGNVDAEGKHISFEGTGVASPRDISLSGSVVINGPLVYPSPIIEWVANYELDMSFDNVNGHVMVGNETSSVHTLVPGAVRAGLAPTVNYVDDGKALLVTWHPVVSHSGSGLAGALVGAAAFGAAGAAVGLAEIPIPIFGPVLGGVIGGIFGGFVGYETTEAFFPDYRAAIYAKCIVKPIGNCGVSIREIGSGGLVEYHSSISGISSTVHFDRSNR
jgi:RHS repeat-associated protein